MNQKPEKSGIDAGVAPEGAVVCASADAATVPANVIANRNRDHEFMAPACLRP